MDSCSTPPEVAKPAGANRSVYQAPAAWVGLRTTGLSKVSVVWAWAAPAPMIMAAQTPARRTDLYKTNYSTLKNFPPKWLVAASIFAISRELPAAVQGIRNR